MKIQTSHIVLLLLALLATGCLKEDLSACRSSFHLLFSYKGDGQEEIFQQKIQNVHLYVFDADNRFIHNETITPDMLAVSPATTLDLPAGKYRIVSVGNYCDKTVVAGLTEEQVCNLESVLLGHPCTFNGGEITGNDSLYMAITDVEIPPTGATADTARFAASHYDLYVEVRGVDAGKTSLNLKQPYQHINFTNSPCGEACCYRPECKISGAGHTTLISRINIPRFSATDPVTLEVVDRDGYIIHTVDVRQFIANARIDLSKQEVLLPILIEFKSIGVTVSVPEWASQIIQPEF